MTNRFSSMDSFLQEISQAAQKLRPSLDAKYGPDAPVAWDVNRKDRSTRFKDSFEYSLDDGSCTIMLAQEDSAQDVGSCVWTAAIAFSKFLEHHYRQMTGLRCIELGSGTGLVGLVAASIGASVVVTDLDRIMGRLGDNVIANSAPTEDSVWRGAPAGGKVRAAELCWGETPLEQFEPPFDLVLACEVIYEPELVPPLLATLRTLAGPEGSVLLAYDCRGRAGVRQFLESAREVFEIKDVEQQDLHPDYIFNKVKIVRLEPLN